MPFIRVWVHLIWSTKNREKSISSSLKAKLIEHIKSNAEKKKLWLDSLNCTDDHIHLLVSLNAEDTISKVVMLLKGESSHWVNQNKLIPNKFEWQDEYIAISVSESIVENVRKYISSQEEHHKKKSFTDEYEEFMKKFGYRT